MHATSPLTFTAPQELRTYALACLLEPDPATKVAMVAGMAEAQLSLDAQSPLAPTSPVPGRPERPELVPRTLEARGLDAIPPLRAKLARAGDLAAAAILDIILRYEVGHVEIGNRWYGYLCDQRGLELRATYAELALRYEAPTLRGPFNLEARRRAGFSELELSDLPA